MFSNLGKQVSSLFDATSDDDYDDDGAASDIDAAVDDRFARDSQTGAAISPLTVQNGDVVGALFDVEGQGFVDHGLQNDDDDDDDRHLVGTGIQGRQTHYDGKDNGDDEGDEVSNYNDEDASSMDSEEYEELQQKLSLLTRIESEPVDIYICGMPASGKTTVLGKLRDLLGANQVFKPHMSHIDTRIGSGSKSSSASPPQPSPQKSETRDETDDEKRARREFGTVNLTQLCKEDPKTYWSTRHTNNMCQLVCAYASYTHPHSRFNLVETCVQEELYAWIPFTRSMGYVSDLQHWTILQSVTPFITDTMQNQKLFKPFKIFIYLNVSANECSERYDLRKAAYERHQLAIRSVMTPVGEKKTEEEGGGGGGGDDDTAQRPPTMSAPGEIVPGIAPSKKTASPNGISLRTMEESDRYDYLQCKLRKDELSVLQKCYHQMFMGSGDFTKNHNIMCIQFERKYDTQSEEFEIIMQSIVDDILEAACKRRVRMIRRYKLEDFVYRIGREQELLYSAPSSPSQQRRRMPSHLSIDTRQPGIRDLIVATSSRTGQKYIQKSRPRPVYNRYGVRVNDSDVIDVSADEEYYEHAETSADEFEGEEVVDYMPSDDSGVYNGLLEVVIGTGEDEKTQKKE